MKNLIIYCFTVLLISSCNQKKEEKNITTTTSQIETKKISNNKTVKNRAEELIAIRDLLKEKLPVIIIERFPNQIEKLQYALIADGYNITLEETAKKSLHYRNQYQRYMSIFMDENFTYKDVAVALSNYKKFEENRKNKNDEQLKKNVLSNLKNTTLNQIKESSKNGLLIDTTDSFMYLNAYLKEQHPYKEIKYNNVKFENNFTTIFVDIYEGEKNIYSYIFTYRLDLNEFTFLEKGLPDIIYDGD